MLNEAGQAMVAGFLGHIYIRKMSNKFPEVSQPQKPQETSENLGNLMTWKLMSFFAETSYKNCPRKPLETWKPEKLSNYIIMYINLFPN